MAVAGEATRRRHYFNPMVSTRKDGKPSGLINCLLPSVQKCREICSALCARAMLRIDEGKPDAAWQDLLACHRLGRLMACGATLIESLVGIAIDVIATQSILAYLDSVKLTSLEVMKHLQDLQASPTMPLLCDKINEGERFFFLDSLQMIRRGGQNILNLLGISSIMESDQTRQILENMDWTPALRHGNRWYDRLAEALQPKERTERIKQINGFEEEMQMLKKSEPDPDGFFARVLEGKLPADKMITKKLSDVLIGLHLPSIRKLQEASDRSEQIQRNLHLAFALAAYQRDHKRYPKKLADLAPKYLTAVPNHLFSGQAMNYRPAENGYLLYSIGVNGKDDQSRWHDDDPPGDDPRVIMPVPEWKRSR